MLPRNLLDLRSDVLGTGISEASRHISNGVITPGNKSQSSSAIRLPAPYLSRISPKGLAERANNFEKLATSEYLTALRSISAEDFRPSIKRALAAQRQSTTLFQRAGPSFRARALRSQSLEILLNFWLSTSFRDKKRLLEESWSLARRALESFHASKSFREYTDTYNRLSFAVGLGVEHDGHLRSRLRKLREATEHGRRALSITRSLGDKTELTKALIRLAIFLDGLSDDLSDRTKQRDLRRESRRLWEEAFRVSRNLALHEITHPLHGFQVMDPGLNIKICEEAVGIVMPQKDNFALGRLMEFLTKWTFYAAESSGGGDPTVSSKMHAKALHYAEEAARHYDIINFTSPTAGVLWVHSPHTEHFSRLARYETDPDKRTLLEEKSLASTSDLLNKASRIGSPRVRFYAFNASANAEINVAEKAKSRRRQRSLFQRALTHRIQTKQLTPQTFGPTSWNRGIGPRGLAETLAKLAELENDPKRKTELLVEAIRNQEKSVRWSVSFVRQIEQSKPHYYTESTGRYYTQYGDLLLRMAFLAKSKKDIRKAAKSYSTAAEWYERIPRHDRSAECYWKSAECYDQLQAYGVASEDFALAARSYSKLGRRIPPLKQHSQEYSHYLQAWSTIEKARSCHLNQQFGLAADSYRRAARLHRSTRKWRIISPYYMACSRLESGERLSRIGRHEAAVEAFREAATMFRESKDSFKERLHQIESPEERTIIEKLSNSSRDAYCVARVGLEKAMKAEAQQDYRTSFEEYGLSSDRFREISSLSESEEDRREASFLSTLCGAWQLASKSELENSVRHLRNARVLFRRAKVQSPDEKSLKLATGHEAFCEAMIECRRFVETLDPEIHDKASKQLELAYECYLDAGFKTAAHNARARRLLLNASLLLSNARDQPIQEKTELYELADSLLRESSTEFQKAHQPNGRDQAQRLLQRTQTESKASPQLTETLKAVESPPTNTAFYTPTQGNEKAFGVARFDRADIETTLVNVTRDNDDRTNIGFDLEISNTGKQPIRLLRVDDVVPQETDLVGGADAWKNEGNSLTHVSRVLAPAKTEKLHVIVRPRAEGLLRIRPKVVFADESGWRWERLMDLKMIPTSKIIEFLALSFVKDNAARLTVDQCGWRSLMEIVKRLGIPRSHVYGEPRYGRAFGRQLDLLVKSSLVEYRIFPRERGRGGNIIRVRIKFDSQDVRIYVEDVASSEGIWPIITQPSGISPLQSPPLQTRANIAFNGPGRTRAVLEA